MRNSIDTHVGMLTCAWDIKAVKSEDSSKPEEGLRSRKLREAANTKALSAQ